MTKRTSKGLSALRTRCNLHQNDLSEILFPLIVLHIYHNIFLVTFSAQAIQSSATSTMHLSSSLTDRVCVSLSTRSLNMTVITKQREKKLTSKIKHFCTKKRLHSYFYSLSPFISLYSLLFSFHYLPGAHCLLSLPFP